MIIPVIAFYAVFCYTPMYGAVIAFKDYSPGLGIFGSSWIGFENFSEFFKGAYFFRILRNTLTISLQTILFGFPAPIILALLINDLSHKKYARLVQTVTYMPHFISLVVVCGIIKEMVSADGMISYILSMFGAERQNLLQIPSAFAPIYVISGIWQEIGWNSVIYIAAFAAVDQELYEAAALDGAGRFRQVLSVTLPGIMPTIITMFILKMGTVMNVGFEKIILLYNSMTYEKADVISSYVYRVGLQDFRYGYSTAVGLFNSVINFTLIIISNSVCKKLNGNGLW